MALPESATIAYGGGAQPELQQQHHHHQPQSVHDQESLKDPLNKQNSILSLTLDEIQLKSGKSFGSMNMDEFINNLWIEDNQNEPTNSTNTHIQPASTLTRQNSYSIPIKLSKKTVEEVWSEIQKEQPVENHVSTDHEPPQRQPTFGEITLEDFLIKAGIVQEPSKSSSHQKMVATEPAPPVPVPNIPNNIPSNNGGSTCFDANYGMGHMMGLGFSSQPTMGNNFAPVNNGYGGTYSIYTQVKSSVGDFCHADESMMVDGSGIKMSKKRIIDGPPEVVVERRQRRMIKNRESAARSRARKQAYTVELELELNQLRKENENLKQIVKELEQKRKQEILKRKQSTMAQKRATLLKRMRRTASMAW